MLGGDRYLWPRQSTTTSRWSGPRAQAWIFAELCGDRFEQMRAETLEDPATPPIDPYPRRPAGQLLYDFWVDARNLRR